MFAHCAAASSKEKISAPIPKRHGNKFTMNKKHLILVLFIITFSTSVFAVSYKGIGKNSVSAETIRKFAPPALDPVIEKKVQNMLDIKTPGMGMISPDGKSLYFTWRVTGTVQVWKIDGPNTFPIQLTGGKDATYIVGITPDGKWLLVSRDEDGDENPGLYLLSPNGGALIEVQKKKDIQTRLEHISSDSKWVYYSSNDIVPDSYAVYRYNIETKQKELLLKDPGIWAIADDRNDKVFLMEKAKGSMSYEYWEFDIANKKLTPVIGQNEDAEYRMRFGPSKGEYFVLTPKMSDFRKLYLYKNKEFKSITGDMPYDVETFATDDDKSKIYYSVNDKGYTRTYVKDANSFKDIALPKLEGIHVYFGTISKNGRYVTLGTVTAKAPSTNYVFDWKTKKLTRWSFPSTPEIDTSKFAEESLEYYPARDGTMIPMFVKRPAGCKDKTCPVIVDFHGGPEAQSTPGFSLVDQLFVDEGFVLVSPNVRGSDGYGKKWLDADNGPKRLDVITDIEDCAKFIREKWAFNGVAPKIGVMGGSYGGYSTLMAMTYFAGAYDAGVSVVGMSNLVTFLNNTAPYRRILRITEYGDPVKDKEALLKLSPVMHISKIKAPLMIIQGVTDPRVPAGEAVQMYDELRKKKIPAGLILFANEGHGSKKRENIVQEFGQTIGFFKKHLLGK